MKEVRSRLLIPALSLCILASTIVASNLQPIYPVRSAAFGVTNSVWGDWLHYHNYAEITSTILDLNETYPDLVEVFPIGQSWLNQTIYCVRLTNESAEFSKPEVFFVGYHHAREPITSELTLYFLVDTVTKFGINETITRMLNYCQIYVVVALNVDGYEAVKANEWHRKNVHPYDEDADGLLDEDPPEDEDCDGYIEDLYFDNGTHYEFIRWEGNDSDADGFYNEDWVGGVDLNRNYDWNTVFAQGSPDPKDETYRGPTPFSEPETQAIRNLTLHHDFRYALSFHSGTFQVVGRRGRNTVDDKAYREVTLNLSALAGVPCDYSVPGGYPTGMWEDWMYSAKNTVALTCEIYGNDSALVTEAGPEPDTYWERGVTQFFSPDAADIEEVVLNWMPTFYYVVDRAITEAYDASISSIVPSKTVLGEGFSMIINVTTINQGRFSENLTVTLYANETAIGTRTVEVASKQSVKVSYLWNSSSFSIGAYRISSVVASVRGETDTADNTYTGEIVTVAMQGDVNADKTVNIFDVVILAIAFDSRPGDSEWNPIADINNDGIVDIFDLVVAAINFGETA